MSVERLITDNIDVWTSTVKTKSASGRGSSKKIELYGIKKLRELILELAVRGKLVPQDPNDEPASVLLERIAEEKAQLVKEKKIKKSKQLLDITEDELLFDLPNGWAWCRVGNLFKTIQSGGTPSKRESTYWEGDIPWASVKDLGKSLLLADTQDHISQEGLEAGSKLANKGDLLICTRMGLGKIGIVSTPMAFNQDLKAVSVTKYVHTDFFLNSYRTIKIKGTGTTVAGITQDQLLNYIFALPPEQEQNRIVTKVDELMSLCDQLEQQTETSIEAHQTLVEVLLNTLTSSADAQELTQNWQRISEHFDALFTTEKSIDTLKQTILQLAVMGKLVPQDPNDELQPIDLVTVVQEQRVISSLAKNTGKLDLNTFELFSEKMVLPSNWTVHPLAEIALAVVDCPHSTPKWTDIGEVCVRTTQMAPFFLDLSISRYVSSDTYLKRIERLKPESDDILYSREGGILGVACRVPSGVGLCLGQRMIVIRPSGLIASRFLELVLNSPLVNEIARHNTTGGAAPRVNVNVIKGYPIPLPPLDEQNRVITKVEKLIDLCDLLKVRLKSSQTTQLHLTDAIIDKAL